MSKEPTVQQVLNAQIKAVKKEIGETFIVSDSIVNNDIAIYYSFPGDDDEVGVSIGSIILSTLVRSGSCTPVEVSESYSEHPKVKNLVELRARLSAFIKDVQEGYAQADPDDVEDCIAALAALTAVKRFMYPSQEGGIAFKSLADAKRARVAVVDALFAHRYPDLISSDSWPDWAQQALAAGWTAPKGWTP